MGLEYRAKKTCFYSNLSLVRMRLSIDMILDMA